VKVETQARLEGRNMSMVLAPDRKPLPKGTNDEPAGAAAADAPVSADGDQPAAIVPAEQVAQPATTQSA
jgi:hypothetical protein